MFDIQRKKDDATGSMQNEAEMEGLLALLEFASFTDEVGRGHTEELGILVVGW